MSMNVRQALEKIESLLGVTVGVEKTVEMTPAEFVAHASSEIAKAMGETQEISTRRLKSLLHAVKVFKDNYVDGESESVKVPLTFVDTTALKEKQTQLIDPLKAGGATQNESAFTQGFVTKINQIKSLVEELKAKTPDEPNETGESGATRGGDADEEDKKARKVLEDAGLHKAASMFANEDEKKAKAKKTDGEEGASATGATAAEPPKGTPEEEGKSKAKKSVKKGVDASADGTVWPTDLNDPAFVKDGKVEKSLDWGND